MALIADLEQTERTATAATGADLARLVRMALPWGLPAGLAAVAAVAVAL